MINCLFPLLGLLNKGVELEKLNGKEEYGHDSQQQVPALPVIKKEHGCQRQEGAGNVEVTGGKQ